MCREKYLETVSWCGWAQMSAAIVLTMSIKVRWFMKRTTPESIDLVLQVILLNPHAEPRSRMYHRCIMHLICLLPIFCTIG